MKPKETLICKKCGRHCKSSKGCMNFHNIETSDLYDSTKKTQKSLANV